LDQKRAVVLDKAGKAASTLLQQLNAIRNAKAEKRREAVAKKRVAHAKKLKEEEEWRNK
jgi:hypothetical protein